MRPLFLPRAGMPVGGKDELMKLLHTSAAPPCPNTLTHIHRYLHTRNPFLGKIRYSDGQMGAQKGQVSYPRPSSKLAAGLNKNQIR